METENIVCNRFILKVLHPEEVSPEYLSWLKAAENQKYIINAKSFYDIEKLKEYVAAKLKDPEVIFWGIYVKENDTHVGNIKYEPIKFTDNYAVMGILIGEEEWRGKSVASEVIRATAIFLRTKYAIAKIVLGVQKVNVSAIRAYEKIGFYKAIESLISTDEGGLEMHLDTGDLL